jgi:polyhydroxybutyrate depolymerase
MFRRGFAVVCVFSSVALAACTSSSSGGNAGTTPATSKTSATSNPSASATINPTSIAAQPSAGCSSTTAATSSQNETFAVPGGKSGVYIQDIPTNYVAGTPSPVVFDLHGLGETAGIEHIATKVGQYGVKNGFITITPGLTEKGTGRWDWTENSADLQWIGKLMTHVEDELCVDKRRVFFNGLSMGAFTTSAVACQFSDRVAAVGPVAGIEAVPWCKADRPVPVITFHGTKDPYVPFDGSAHPVPTPDGSAAILPGIDANGMVVGTSEKVVMPAGTPITDNVVAWAKRNGCGAEPKQTQVASDVTLNSYPCPAGAEVEFYVVKDGGHTWPGNGGALPESYVGRTTESIDANALEWAFFQAHPLPTPAP